MPDKDKPGGPGGYVGGRPKDPSKLSTKPSQIRNRLRRRVGPKYDEDIRLYSIHAYGKPVEEWDLEELARGQIRNKSGNFQGTRATWITPAIQKEAKRRLVEDVYGKLAGQLGLAIQTMANLMMSDEVDEKGKRIVDSRTKFAAAAFIIEHLVGKPKALVEITGVEEAQNAIAAAIVLDDGQPQDNHQVIDGEGEWGDIDDGSGDDSM